MKTVELTETELLTIKCALREVRARYSRERENSMHQRHLLDSLIEEVNALLVKLPKLD